VSSDQFKTNHTDKLYTYISLIAFKLPFCSIDHMNISQSELSIINIPQEYNSKHRRICFCCQWHGLLSANVSSTL